MTRSVGRGRSADRLLPDFSRTTRISTTIGLINQVIQQKERPNDTPSECYCGAFVTGLFIIAKWISEGRLDGIDEMYLGALIQDIRMIITDYYNYNPEK